MARLSIPKVRDDRDPVEYRLRLEPRLNDELVMYRQLYVRTYGQEVETKDLLEPILRRFLATDREVRRFKKQRGDAYVNTLVSPSATTSASAKNAV